MAQAYTPGLTVAESTTLRKERKLPLTGEVLANVGDCVEASAVVARTSLPGDVHLVNLSNTLSVPESDVESCLRVSKGSPVQANQIIAETKGLFGLFKSTAVAPVAGTLESVSTVTGQAILREPPTPLEVVAYVNGEIVEVLPNEGVVVETRAAFAQGIFGIGGESFGEIVFAAETPNEPFTQDAISPNHRGKIVVGGGRLTALTVAKAREVGVKGLVAGGIDDADLRELLGYELGVAITGTEALGLTVIITEGFGDIAMATRTFELLKSLEGCFASINGATQIRAGVMRPEIVVPIDHDAEQRDAPLSLTLQTGVPVRLIREPRFGEVGIVAELPVELRTIETEARVRVVTVELTGGERVTLPRANIELISG